MIFFNKEAEIAKFDVMINQEMIRFPRMFEKLISEGTLSASLLEQNIIATGEAKLIGSVDDEKEMFFGCLYPEVGFFEHLFRLDKTNNQFTFMLRGIYDYDGITIMYIGTPSKSVDTQVAAGGMFLLDCGDLGKGISPNSEPSEYIIRLATALLKSPNFKLVKS